MTHLLKIFFWGMIMSFLGSLPLGTLNVTVVNITMKEGIRAALVFSFGSMVAEVTMVRLGLIGMTWVYRHHKIFRFFEWVTILLLLILSIASFVAAIKKSGIGSALPPVTQHPFWLGGLLSVTNPLHYIFWFGWSTVLISKNILLARSWDYNWYVAGIGLGTIAGFAVFIYGENYLVNTLKANEDALNWIIGITLFITVFIQLYKTLTKPVLTLPDEKP
jgi:threonine/homoserine/homoserine lactone efflux protein